MPFNSFKLCQVMEQYPCLYNPNLPEYLKKEEAEKAWNEISLLMDESVTECKTRWYNIRGNFSKNLKSNAVYSNGERKKYYLDEHLSFLRPFMKSANKQKISNDKFHEIDFDSESHGREEQIYVQCDHSQENDNEFIIFNESDDDPIPKRRKKNNSIPEDDPLTDAVLSLISRTKKEKDDASPEMNFLMSLLPDFKKMNDRQKFKFKAKVMGIIGQILYDEVLIPSPENDQSITKTYEDSQEF